MDSFRIIGGKPLTGTVEIAGAKNAALPLMCAAILTSETVHLTNIPVLRDIKTLQQLLTAMGAQIVEKSIGKVGEDPHAYHRGQELSITFSHIHCSHAPYDLVKTMRASVLVLGPLLARHGYARVSLPGGCAIGARPIDIHLKGLEAMGAKSHIENGDVIMECNRLTGAIISMDTVTVTGTENLMMAACLADGKTILDNAAREPEVVDLAQLLQAMGANITGAGTSRIVIEGVSTLRGARYCVIPDRIETGTFLAAVTACGGDVTIKRTQAELLEVLIDKLRSMGAHIDAEGETIHIRMRSKCSAISIRTDPYPGFPTDMQAQMMALNTIAQGSALISETIFENRFLHVTELIRMGAKIRIDTHSAFVEGVDHLQGAQVMATDLRASACLVIAGLAAKGESIIDRIYHLDRGYVQLEKKLSQLGAKVERINTKNASS